MKGSKVHTWTKQTGKLKLRTLQKQRVKEVNIFIRKAKEYPFSFDWYEKRKKTVCNIKPNDEKHQQKGEKNG